MIFPAWAKFSARREIYLGLLGFALTALFFFALSHHQNFFEPDRLYHFALLREMAAQRTLALKTWGSFPLLGWNEYFSDKEFLYHLLLYGPWRLGAENGVLVACAFFSAGLVWLPYFALPGARIWAIGCSVIFLLLNQLMVFRFGLVRPHVLAVLLFSALVFASLRGKAGWCLIFSALFALAYHAFYLPLAFGVFLFAAGYLSKGARPHNTLPCAAALGGGLALGILVNPYFPSNLVRALQTLLLALTPGGLPESVRLNLSFELQPYSLGAFSSYFAVSLGAYIFSAWSLRKASPPVRALSWFTALLWLGASRTPRAAEFAVPLTAILVALAARERKWAPRRILPALALAQAALFFTQDFWALGPSQIPPANFFKLLLRKVPAGEALYHSAWSFGPYIIWARPDLTAVDALDPTYLWMHDPDRYELSWKLDRGGVAEPVPAIEKIFGARYALVELSPLSEILRRDPAAELIESANHQLFLFRLKPPPELHP